MEKLFEKMKEYLGMEDEIPFEEFEAYYQEVIAFLTGHHQGLDKEDALKSRFILSILVSNSGERAKRNKNLAKKYKKMGEKCTFWVEAMDYRLLKQGMNKQQILQAEKEISDSI
ncbi:hypothetical protein [Desulforamulus aquiferis]|uniref:Uncharacterized protein n=1 Tax=Desulforamulus aquiferis TaxID=1397668 RepID=A0AAW7ZC64_9FIRM|nr:hypothetical protein [Desulforamulus aquiferis]MDO7786926.1 hypothetical protein [Desulforamulus aquiferis]RYD03954.1 hypothetical protein N752_17885 [Desulforamulus aquiferis]